MYHIGNQADEPHADQITRFIRAVTSNRCTVILGAGASMPIIPSLAGLNAQALARLDSNTLFIAPGKLGAPVDRNWLWPAGYEMSAFIRGAIRQTNTEQLRLLEHSVTKPPPLASAPVQYAVFNLFSTQAAVINLNTDRLAERFCPQRTWNVHGGFSSEYPYGWNEQTLFDLAGSNVNVAPPTQHYFEPEPLGFYDLFEALLLNRILSNSTDIVLIGYSFAKWGNRLNDSELYDIFVSSIARLPIRITIVNPSGHELVERLKEDTGSQDIVCIPAYWNHLARAIMTSSRGTPLTSIQHEEISKDVLKQYFTFVDSDHGDLMRDIQRLGESWYSGRISDDDFQSRKNVLSACF
jgi:hypothetical protein